MEPLAHLHLQLLLTWKKKREKKSRSTKNLDKGNYELFLCYTQKLFFVSIKKFFAPKLNQSLD